MPVYLNEVADNPATLPSAGAGGVFFSRDDKYIAMNNSVTPFVHVWPWSGIGFGAKYSNPATIPSSAVSSALGSFSPDGAFVAFCGSDKLYVYPWSASGFGTKVADPATLPGYCYSGLFSPNGDIILAVGSNYPFLYAYPWTGSAFGTKIEDPSTGFNSSYNSGKTTKWSPNGLYVAHIDQYGSNPPYLHVIGLTASGGWGTKWSVNLGAGTSFNELDWHPDGTHIVIGGTLSPYLHAYPWNPTTGFGTRIDGAPGNLIYGLAWASDGKELAIQYGSGGYSILRIPWTGSAFGTIGASEALATGGGYLATPMSVSRLGSVGIGFTTSPYIRASRTMFSPDVIREKRTSRIAVQRSALR